MCSGLAPDDYRVVYSFGVGEDISFDKAVIEKYDSSVYAFDPTPQSIDWVKKNAHAGPRFSFFPYGIAAYDGCAVFYPPEDHAHVSCTILKKESTRNSAFLVPVKRFATIVRSLQHKKIDVLKMDIEGAEYDVIDDILNSKVLVKQVLVEFHHRFDGVGLERTLSAIRRLNNAGFKITAISKSGQEYSFINEPFYKWRMKGRCVKELS